MNRRIRKVENAQAKDIDLFLSQYQKGNTKNGYIARLKNFYGKFRKLTA